MEPTTNAPATDDTMTAALLREREGYRQRGMTDRADQVTEQLRLRGYTEGGDTPPAKELDQSTDGTVTATEQTADATTTAPEATPADAKAQAEAAQQETARAEQPKGRRSARRETA